MPTRLAQAFYMGQPVRVVSTWVDERGRFMCRIQFNDGTVLTVKQSDVIIE